jgi:NAD(P)-dependent dehydrogenase (short-subunit alcohol dehydrogenase family)
VTDAPPPVALVTGGGGGLGRAVARALLATGSPVALLDRHAGPLEEAARVLAAERAGARVEIAVADVSDRAGIDAAVRRVRADLGPIRVLVNSAGVAESGPVMPPDDALFDRTVAVNLRGAWVLTTACLPDMLAARWGRVVHVASTASLRGFRYVPAYVASKHGLLGLVRALALDLREKGVAVNAVCPGFMDTPMTERTVERVMRATGTSREQALAGVLASDGQTRLVDPADVAREVVRLCGPDAGTGEAVEIR